MSMPRFFAVNDRPVKVVKNPKGGWDAFALDIGEWVDGEAYLDRYMRRDGDIDEYTEQEFNDRDALDFAFDLHREQERKGSGVPYVAHLLGVSSMVLEHGGEGDLAIAGLLHDETYLSKLETISEDAKTRCIV